jgi:hypothetical protein
MLVRVISNDFVMNDASARMRDGPLARGGIGPAAHVAQTKERQTMQVRLRFLITAVTMSLVFAAPILADQLLGVVQEVDVAAKKIVVKPKGEGKEAKNVVVTVTDDTVYESAKGKTLKKSPLEKLKKGVVLDITHEDAKASKIILKGNPNAKKKAEGKGKPAND